MLRRSLLVIPLLTAAAAMLGIAGSGRPVPVVAGAAIAGFLTALALAAVAERRVQRIGAQVHDRLEELADERARIQRLLDDLPLAVLLFTSGSLNYTNPTARTIFELPGEGGASIAALEEAVAEAAETGRTIEVELRAGSRDLRATASPTAPGEVAVVVSDLTETRRVEAMRRAFVTNASHELKTPVAGIQALADSLAIAVERDPARARTMLDRLRVESVRLARLVRDLLDLARLEEATTQRARRVDLAQLVRSQVDRLADLAEERKVTVHIATAGSPHVIAVPEDLRLVAGNLIENAVRYNREGGEVRVSIRRAAGEVSLVVADTGIGISESDRERVFERFYRVDKGRSRAAGGTGLGLSLVRHATERLGGRVTLESEPGRGSTFSVVLPVEGRSLDSGWPSPSEDAAATDRVGVQGIATTEEPTMSQERTRFPIQPEDRYRTARSSDDVAAHPDEPVPATDDERYRSADPPRRAPAEEQDKPRVPPHQRGDR